jgi:Na+-translocating ferredoxin:NAD+ oxidoreductase RNF subunit RnfB
VIEKRCPAKVCKPLLHFEIDVDKCRGCGLCRKKCPSHAIIGVKKECHCIDEELCERCGICFDTCKFNAIQIA